MWIVGNETDCSSEVGNSAGAKCYDVKFEPNDSALNSVSKRNIKVSLLSNELLNSTVVDTQTLDFTFTTQSESGISLGAGVTDSENITFLGSETSFPTISKTATIYKESSERIVVEAVETTNTHIQSPTATNGTNSTVSNAIGFDSKTYGTNFTYGKWYFEEVASGNTVGDPVDTDTHRITSKIRFRPDVNAIRAIGAGQHHKSELKITIKDGATTVATKTITINLSRPSTPVLTIEALNTTIE